MVTGEEKLCQEFVASRLAKTGCKVDMWETDWDAIKNAVSAKTGRSLYVPVETWMTNYQGFKNRPNVVGVLKGSGGGRSLLLNGHVDVVPPGPREKWTHDPWGAEIDGDKLYGRGAEDMKAGAAAMIIALDCIASAGIKLKGDVVVESVIDEETGGNGTLACLLRGYRADAGIFTEPTDMEIHIQSSGAQYFKFSVTGKLTHLANKYDGVNAIHKAMKIIEAIKDWESYRTVKGHERYPLHRRWPIPFPVECGAISAGSLNSFEIESPAELCVVGGAYQSMPHERIEDVNKDLNEFIMRVASTDPWLREHPPKVEFIGLAYEGAMVDPGHPIVGALSQAYRQVLGAETTIAADHSGNDMRLYTNHGGTPSVVFGPGSAKTAHFPDEHVRLDQYLDAIRILAATAVDWCGHES
jgi:acetylornithine deacetylase